MGVRLMENNPSVFILHFLFLTNLLIRVTDLQQYKHHNMYVTMQPFFAILLGL